LNQTTGAYRGSVRTRFSDRKPQTHSSAPLSPVLHFNPYRGDMGGGISGTCARPDGAWVIPPRSRLRDHRPSPA
jgi:hypothetical protein